MNVQSFNVQNRGTFRVEDVALKSGDTNPDREQGNPVFVTYAQGDQVAFRHTPSSRPPQGRSVAQRRYRLETNVIVSLVFSLLTAAFFHALWDRWPFVTVLVGLIAFTVFYIMSFFNFEEVLRLIEDAPARGQSSRPAYSRYHYPIYRQTGPLRP